MNKAYPDPKPGKKKKKKRKADEAYLNFIRSQPCIICGQKSVAHHEPLKKDNGTALKGPDRETLPLHQEYHSERHTIGKLTFYEKYQIDHVQVIKDLQNRYDNLKGGNTKWI